MTRPAKSYFAVVEPRDELIWDICQYLRPIHEECTNCPAWQFEPEHPTIKTKRMCRALAEEIAAKVLKEFTVNPVVTFELK